MRPFPGEIKRGAKRVMLFNDEQVAWLHEYFPKMENARVAKAMGIGEKTVCVIAKRMGLQKSEAGLRAIRKRQQKRAYKTNMKNGMYERKRGHLPSEATMEGNRKRWQKVHEGLIDSPVLILKKRDPKKFQEMLKEKSLARKEMFRKEKMRMIYGLERKTNLGVVMCPYRRSQLHRRQKAMELGYILLEDCSEGSIGRYTIFYDNETTRSKRFETNCIKDGFTFQEWT